MGDLEYAAENEFPDDSPDDSRGKTPMQMSNPIGELATALAKAQGAIKGAIKDSVNPHFQSHYADLASCWDACREALSTNGLALVQVASADGAAVTITTLLAHSSGQWIRGELTLIARDAGAQAVGSAMTYARRYGLASMVGIAPEDDDANEATRHAEQEARTVRAPVKEKPTPAKATTRPTPVYKGEDASQAPPSATASLHPVPESARATIPDGCALIVEARIEPWGTAKGWAKLVDSSGVEGKFAIFKDQIMTLALETCDAGTLIRPGFKQPKNGGKTYLDDIKRDVQLEIRSTVELVDPEAEVPF